MKKIICIFLMFVTCLFTACSSKSTDTSVKKESTATIEQELNQYPTEYNENDATWNDVIIIEDEKLLQGDDKIAFFINGDISYMTFACVSDAGVNICRVIQGEDGYTAYFDQSRIKDVSCSFYTSAVYTCINILKDDDCTTVALSNTEINNYTDLSETDCILFEYNEK